MGRQLFRNLSEKIAFIGQELMWHSHGNRVCPRKERETEDGRMDGWCIIGGFENGPLRSVDSDLFLIIENKIFISENKKIRTIGQVGPHWETKSSPSHNFFALNALI